jgi:hypothetical protein
MKRATSVSESGTVFLAYLNRGIAVSCGGDLKVTGFISKYHIQALAKQAGLDVKECEGKEVQDVAVLIDLEEGEVQYGWKSTEVKVITGKLEFEQ